MKIIYSLPNRKYCTGDKKMVSLRLPQKLVEKIESIAEKKGWTVTDVVTSALDDYAQYCDQEFKKK